ncbi:MAG: tetratricopeptide repeat protein [Halanaerobium sp. MSAO_Bac5]|nr:MAG: tetratricopeptide repeat protein [Halanaerobium sp. MSAO_Bac5]
MKRNILIFIFLISLIFSLNLTLQADSDLSSEELFSQALKNYNQGNFAQADKEFSQLLSDYDLDAGVEFSSLYYLIMTAVKENRTLAAINSLEKFEELGYQSAALNWQIGQLFLNKAGQFDSADFGRAIDFLEKAQAMGLKSPAFKRDLAYAYRENKQSEKAIELYEEIIKISPTAEDYLNLAKLYENNNNLDEAIKHYETALNREQVPPSIYLNLAKLYQSLGDYSSAVKIYELGIETNPNFTPYYIGIAENHLALNNYAKAEKELNNVLTINKNSYHAYYLLGLIAQERKEYQKALDYYADSLTYNPDYVRAYLAEGKVYLEQEEFAQAITSFAMAVEKNPDFFESRYYLGLAYYNADQMEAAREELRKALHINDRFQKARDLLDKIEKN